MKLADQVCNTKLSKKLKELGVEQQNSTFYWCKNKGERTFRLSYGIPPGTYAAPPGKCTIDKWLDGIAYAAFTVAELGEMLPVQYKTKKNLDAKGEVDGFIGLFWDGQNNIEMSEDRFEANARAKLLIRILEERREEL